MQTIIAESIRYWERRRVFYNIVLIAVALGWLLFTWPHFRPAFTWKSGWLLFLLAVLANACYCAAYLVDFVFQRQSFCITWKRRRWILWCAGTVFAACLAYYWIADEIYPFVM